MIANQEQLAPLSIEPKPLWKRRRVWWFTRLQNGQLVEPGTMVEYEEITIPLAAWMIGSPMRFTKYRSPQVLKGK